LLSEDTKLQEPQHRQTLGMTLIVLFLLLSVLSNGTIELLLQYNRLFLTMKL